MDTLFQRLGAPTPISLNDGSSFNNNNNNFHSNCFISGVVEVMYGISPIAVTQVQIEDNTFDTVNTHKILLINIRLLSFLIVSSFYREIRFLFF